MVKIGEDSDGLRTINLESSGRSVYDMASVHALKRINIIMLANNYSRLRQIRNDNLDQEIMIIHTLCLFNLTYIFEYD